MTKAKFLILTLLLTYLFKEYWFAYIFGTMFLIGLVLLFVWSLKNLYEK